MKRGLGNGKILSENLQKYKSKSRLFDNHTISIYANRIAKNNPDNALEFLSNRMKIYSGHVANSTFNTMIDICGHYGKWTQAWKLFNDMKKRQLIPNEMTISSLFNSLANSKVSVTQELLSKMMEIYLKYFPNGNIYAFNALLKLFSRKGNKELMLNLFPVECHSKHKSFNIDDDSFEWIPKKVDQITFSTMITGLLFHCNDLDTMDKYAIRAVKEISKPNLPLIMALLALKSRQLFKGYKSKEEDYIDPSKLLSLVDLEREVQNIKLHTLVLQILGMKRNKEEGLKYLEKIRGLDPKKMDQFFRDALANFYFNVGELKVCLEEIGKSPNPSLKMIILLMKIARKNRQYSECIDIFRENYMNQKKFDLRNDLEPIYVVFTCLWGEKRSSQDILFKTQISPIISWIKREYDEGLWTRLLNYKAVGKRIPKHSSTFRSTFN